MRVPAFLCRQIVPTRQIRQLFGQFAGQLHPGRAAADAHRQAALAPGRVGFAHGGRHLNTNGGPQAAPVFHRPERQRALGHTRNAEVLTTAI